jgi:hypothetical protein
MILNQERRAFFFAKKKQKTLIPALCHGSLSSMSARDGAAT